MSVLHRETNNELPVHYLNKYCHVFAHHNRHTSTTMASATSFRELIGVSPSTASPKDSTLIIIDAQNEYAEGKLKVSNAPSSRKAIADLLQKYRDADGKIVHVTHVVPDGAPVFTPKTKLAEEFEELAPRQGEKVVQKHFPSAFAQTDLQAHLKELGSEKIVLTGYMVRQHILAVACGIWLRTLTPWL